jgi:hydroxylamine reductase
MFCYQCEQTAKGEGCTKVGVCGKQPDAAAMQDLMVFALVGLAQPAVEARSLGIAVDREIGVFTCEALFSTLTNVNFDPARFVPLLKKAVEYREQLTARVKAGGGKAAYPGEASAFQPAGTMEALVGQGQKAGVRSYPGANADIASLKHTLLFGMKGIAAYADHAQILGQEDESVYAFLHRGLAALADKTIDLSACLGLVLECGRTNLRAMELLDAGNTGRYGHPVPTKVPLGVKKGKAILISGHDLRDLEELLKQTEGKGISIYTHGEMLPAHGYPLLKKYSHLYGHYGTAWQNQFREFSEFPGAILMTTNCIQRPQTAYKDRIFTSGVVGWPDVTHIGQRDFAPVVAKALQLPGFSEDRDGKSVLTGFGRNAVLGVAGKVVELVRSGKIRHFFLVGGCDGAKPGRDYYTRFVEQVPKDCVVLTLACGKFRFFDKDLGAIDGIPRLLDVGQCNDAFSAVQIALALAGAFKTGVNELPLSLVLSWYEQKAVAILLSLLALGIKDIRLGPSLPAFVTPAVLDVLVKNYGIKPISTPEADLKAILG